MRPKCSAYLSIYNDFDLLEPALRSVAPMVDELVVVDGAYCWMEAYFRGLGQDPMRSDRRVYDAIEAAGIPYVVISRLWPSEIEKRIAGYQACSHRYVLRVDADEVLTFDAGEMRAFFAAGGAVADMEMPIYLAPGWIRGAPGGGTDRQCFLFDSEQVPAAVHLNYLWLVLTADALPRAGERPVPVHPRPVAFNAHLTEWRSPQTAVNRAAFYWLNFMRAHGVPWLAGLADRKLRTVQDLLERVPPSGFKDVLLGSRQVAGFVDLAGGQTVCASPLTALQEAAFADRFDRLMDGHVALNAELARGRHFVTGLPVTIDISTPAAVAALTPDGDVVFAFSGDVAAAKVEIRWLLCCPPWQAVREVPAWRHGAFLGVRLPRDEADFQDFLRRCLEFHVWMAPGPPLQHFRTSLARPHPQSPD